MTEVSSITQEGIREEVEISTEDRDLIRTMFCSVADTLREMYPKMTVPEIRRALKEIFENAI